MCIPNIFIKLYRAKPSNYLNIYYMSIYLQLIEDAVFNAFFIAYKLNVFSAQNIFLLIKVDTWSYGP